MSVDINDVVLAELELIPRGPRGSPQNLFRAAFQMARTHSLSPKNGDDWSRDECMAIAAKAIRESFPEFVPDLRGRLADRALNVSVRSRN